MSKKIIISVITPAFNSEEFIDLTILSVVEQTFTNWEMLVIDDGSTDGTCEIVQRWQAIDDRIRLLKNTKNIGPGPSRNRGIDEASGRYIAYLDSDDTWLPEKLHVQLEHLKQTRTTLSFTSYMMMDTCGNLSGRIVRAPDSVSYDELLGNTIIGCSTVLVDRNRVSSLEMPAIPSRQPLVLWLQILRETGPARGVDIILAKYRVRPGSVSSNKITAAKQVWRVYREYERIPLVKAVGYFFRYAFRGILKNFRLKR